MTVRHSGRPQERLRIIAKEELQRKAIFLAELLPDLTRHELMDAIGDYLRKHRATFTGTDLAQAVDFAISQRK